MAKNKKFEIILDECMELLLTGQGTIEQCLERYPEYAAELKPLLNTVASIEKAVDVKPSQEFKARAHYQLQLLMAGSAPKRTTFWSLQPKWIIATMAIMVLFLMGGGTVLAANSSMPGSPLYPIKIATENISLQFAGSDIKKAEIYAVLAERRVEEMVYIVENGKTTYAEKIALKYDQTMAALNALPLSAENVLAMSAAGTEKFGATENNQDTSQQASSPQVGLAAPAVTTDTQTNQTGDRTLTTDTAATNTPAPNITLAIPSTSSNTSNKTINSILTDKDKLKQYIAYNAIYHPEKLKELLDKAPENIKPLIRHMIENATVDNTQILDKLDN